MHFVKMNGAGNDYVFVYRPQPPIADPARLARVISDRHYAVGSDGLVLIEDSDVADAGMRIFNADGSEGRMCGNAIRCVAAYLYRTGAVPRAQMDIATVSGVRRVWMVPEGVRVDMGVPRWLGERLFRGQRVSDVDVGNPHAVVFCPTAGEACAAFLRALSHSLPGGVNAEAVEVLSPHAIRVRVYERGSGETLACGTGACAAAFCAARLAGCGGNIEVQLPGGKIVVEVAADRLYMTGDAAINFEGEYHDGSTE